MELIDTWLILHSASSSVRSIFKPKPLLLRFEFNYTLKITTSWLTNSILWGVERRISICNNNINKSIIVWFNLLALHYSYFFKVRIHLTVLLFPWTPPPTTTHRMILWGSYLSYWYFLQWGLYESSRQICYLLLSAIPTSVAYKQLVCSSACSSLLSIVNLRN